MALPPCMTSINPLDSLKIHPAFIALSEKQRSFVVAYIENGQDRNKASELVCADTKDPVASGYQIYRNPRVRRVLNIYYDVKDEQLGKADFLILLSNSIRDGGKDQLKAMQLYAEMKGWLDNPEPEDEPEAPKDYTKELDEYEQGKRSSIGEAETEPGK